MQSGLPSPALLMSLFPYICNWAKLQNDNEGVLMMGQGGGLMCLAFREVLWNGMNKAQWSEKKRFCKESKERIDRRNIKHPQNIHKNLLSFDGLNSWTNMTLSVCHRFSIVITWLFCLCIDRKFLQVAVLRHEGSIHHANSVGTIFQSEECEALYQGIWEKDGKGQNL